MRIENQPSVREKLESSPETKDKREQENKSPDERFLLKNIGHLRTPKEEARIKELEEKLRTKSEKYSSHEHFTKEDHSDINELVALYQKGIAKKEKVKRIVTNLTDFIPLVGSAKMMLEGIIGKQLGTNKKIEGWARLGHGVSGTAFLVLDTTGLGAIASELGKLGIKIGMRALEKEALKKIIRNKIIQKEGDILVARGEKRMNKKEELASA